jgi:hypothetical protein
VALTVACLHEHLSASSGSTVRVDFECESAFRCVRLWRMRCRAIDGKWTNEIRFWNKLLRRDKVFVNQIEHQTGTNSECVSEHQTELRKKHRIEATTSDLDCQSDEERR